jgi:hypothetical protein
MSTPMWDLPEHLEIAVDRNGDGPAEGDDIVGTMCWCGIEGCTRYLENK